MVAAMFATLRARAREALAVGDADNLDQFAGGALRFGFGPRADIRGEDVELGPARAGSAWGNTQFELPVPARIMSQTRLLPSPPSSLLGVTLDEMVSPLAEFYAASADVSRPLARRAASK